MRYSLLLHYPEPGEGEIDPEMIAQAQRAFQAYAAALESAGVLIAAEVLQPSTATTTLSLRTGSLQVQDGPFADTVEALAGIFVLEVPDLDTAIDWAQKCPAAQWGTIEVRPAGTSYIDGAWTA